MSPKVEEAQSKCLKGNSNEQERVQKKTFTNWMNTYLKQKIPPMKVENLFADIKDGVVLLSLLEVLSGEKLAMERGKLKRVHYFSNLSTALKFLENKRIKLVNINVSDIADGKSSIVLGLIWIIILFFQIKEVMVPQETEGTEQLPITALDKIRMNAKKALLSWTENAITKRYGIEVKDFGRSWRDGLAFNAIIHTIRPDLVDMDQVRKQSARVNIESAFSIAEDHLGIARLLDPGDVDVAKPDEKSVMTYVAQFLKTYPEAGEDQSLRKKSQNFAEQELADYKELLTWYQTEAEEVLTIVEPVEDMHQEYMDYLAFKAEVDRRGHIYYKLDEKVRTGKSVKFTSETFKPLEESWKKVVRQTRVWLWKLGASLPGKLGKFGDWVNQAEEILELEEEFLESPNEMAMQLGKILQDHRTFFEEMEPQKIFFQQVPRAGKYEGTQIPAPLMDNLHQRLTRVCTMAPQRERRLEYEEIQYQLLAFLVTSENKLKIWTVKYGHQPKVEALLADYKNFVHSGNLFKNYDQTYETCKRNADAYTKNNDNKKETEKMNAYFDEVNGRWKKVSVEIKSVQFMLEEVIDCWRKYNASVDVLTVWLNDDERVMSRSADEQQQFFADLAKIKEKHKIVNESGNFLIETTEEPVATEIKTTLLMVNRRFQELVESLQHFKKEEVVGKARKDNNDGLLKLTHWLKGAEELMAREVACKHAVLRDYLNDLETFSAQIPAIENDSKTTTETAQSLVKECSQDVVNEMLQSLNIQKEVFVRLRKEIPEKIKHVKAVLPDIESLENGLMDLDAWLSRGEALLQSHTLDGTREETEQRIEKHKVVFSEITYQKSLLDCKNAVYQRVEQMKPKLKNINLYVLDGRVEELNNCFQQMNLVVPIKLEFVVQEEKFLGLVEKAEIAIYQLQQKLQSRENVEETMQKQVMIYQGDFQKTGVKCLDEMDFLSRTLLQHDPRDNTLHNQYGKHRARWDRLKEGTDTTLQLSLQQLPETWKEYHIKLGEFSNCVQTLEEMQRQLQRGYLTSEENKDMQTKFQRALKHIDKFSQDSKWLQSNLEELLADSDNTNKTNERNRLGDMVTRFNNLLPNMETTSNQSAVVSKACDFRDGVKSMIDDLLKQAMDQDNQLFIDGLDEAKSLLHEHEDKMSNLDSLKVHIEEEIMLQEKRNSQTFISQGIHEIKVKLRDARSLFNTLHAKFKKAVEDWQAYEERMTQITQSVDEAEDELVKTQPTRQFTKIELLANMEQLQRTMNTLEVNLSDMQTLNNIVCTGASAASVVCLNKKLADVKYLIENVSFRLSYRVSELVAGNKWRKYNRALQKYEIESNWLCTMKEELRQCDNVTGTDDEIHHRLEICMEITKEANKHRDSFATLVDRVSHMQDKLPAVNVTRMNSDALRIKKKFSEYLARSKEIAEILLATLQQHLMDTQKQHQRWLDAARAKADQCQVITGDRYHLEAKLETIKELINSAGEGEQMKNLATAKIEALKDVLPKGRQAELEEQKRQAETEWQILWNAMQETRVKLEFSIEQCQANEKEYNVMLQWLKDTEALKRNEGVPQPDLQSKSHQFELLKTLAEDVVAHKSEFEAMRESSKNIGPSTGERRFALFTDQLVKRYGALVTSVEILVENCKQNVSDHEGYLQRYMECLEWIKGQQQGLDDCVDTPHNKEMLHAKLAFLSNLTSSNGSGLRCLNTAIESGERLYINTSNEGRDIIRNELKLLRDKWETFNEKLNEIKRKLQLSGMQWSSFDENVEQVEKCFTDFAEQYKNEDDEPMNTLHEKKSALQKNTTRYKNIVLYKTMLDSLSDTGSALATVKAKDKLKELHVKYGALCEIALSKVKKAEEDVNQHQELQDLHQQCRYWVYSTKDNIASCADSSGDRHVLQNKLDKVLDLLKSMRDGDAIASDFYVLAGNTIPNTGLEGQKVIQKDMEDIKETFVTLASRLESIKENLVHALHLVTTYDGLCDQLNTWLREHETANKEINDLKRSQGDKENQSEKLNKIEKEVNAQQRHFDELQDMVSHMEGVDSRLVNYSSQLNFRYETLRTNLQSAVIRWQNYVHEHKAYSTNYTKCTERLDTIQHRLEACAEMTDDRVDIEDGLRKLLMLDAEKEDCVKLIQHTVESGEKLHTSTSAEGKEIIRQELRMLRDLSEQVDDQLIYTQKKLKMCLVHLPTSSEIIEKPLHATDELLNDENNTSVVHMIDEIIYQRELIDDSELQTHIGGSPPPTPSSEEEVFDAINRDSVSAVGKDTCIHAALFPAPSTTCPCSDEELIRLQKENLILQNRLLKKKLNEN